MNKNLLRNIIIVLAVSYIAIAGASPLFAAVTYEDSLVSYWDFEEGSGTTAADAAGANDGTLINDPSWTTGKYGGALNFDGVGAYVDCGNQIALNFGSNNWTALAWIKTITTAEQHIFTRYLPGSWTAAAKFFGLDSAGKLWVHQYAKS
ncbi:MAG: hypothetical protein ABIA77_06685, partial [Candidatus Omnitrophota bacterium]